MKKYLFFKTKIDIVKLAFLVNNNSAPLRKRGIMMADEKRNQDKPEYLNEQEQDSLLSDMNAGSSIGSTPAALPRENNVDYNQVSGMNTGSQAQMAEESSRPSQTAGATQIGAYQSIGSAQLIDASETTGAYESTGSAQTAGATSTTGAFESTRTEQATGASGTTGAYESTGTTQMSGFSGANGLNESGSAQMTGSSETTESPSSTESSQSMGADDRSTDWQTLNDSNTSATMLSDSTHREETAAEIAAPVNLGLNRGKDTTNQDQETKASGGIMGMSALAISILSLFVLPVILGITGVVLGFVARKRGGAKGLANWAIGIGAISIIIGMFVLPFY
ncbi:DUF4190 domain-containing protein [Mesobacillus maritimus]|uniref:DUF4190 domain-containing protein n=1 Tax=Mesobacillus maritimus TaxID=1643336 RepID=A0ABS7K279_9BACI|nr:DUF4190 domain-containing protein [Mesobacillus maritimus]MBY0096357.1 DUF4190 domain-containing protein [Mesobacillus maritimus]